VSVSPYSLIFFFTDTATPHSYTLSLHDALPISRAFLQQAARIAGAELKLGIVPPLMLRAAALFSPFLREVVEMQYQFRQPYIVRSEEHTSELQSRENLVCRLLLEKKNNIQKTQE